MAPPKTNSPDAGNNTRSHPCVSSAKKQSAVGAYTPNAENDSKGYVEALILGTPPDPLVRTARAKKRKGFSPENIARMEPEMALLERDFKAVESGDGQNVVHLTLASAYIRKRTENTNVITC